MARQKVIEVEGRRLRPVRMSPVAAAIGLGLVVIAFVTVLASGLTGVDWLATVGLSCGAVVVVLVARHLWRRLTPRGKWLFGLPVLFFGVTTVLQTLHAPGASVAFFVAFVSFTITVGFGVVGRPSLGGQMALARGSVEPTLILPEAPAETVRLRLVEDGLSLEAPAPEASEAWSFAELDVVRLDAGARLVLRVVDRIGDDVAVQVAWSHRADAEELVRRIEERRKRVP